MANTNSLTLAPLLASLIAAGSLVACDRAEQPRTAGQAVDQTIAKTERQISGIRVDEYTSRVEVPTEAVQKVIEAMHATKVRGRKVRVELEGAPRAAPAALSACFGAEG